MRCLIIPGVCLSKRMTCMRNARLPESNCAVGQTQKAHDELCYIREHEQMELRHLRYFIAVAEEQHVTRAAERLGIQQPPLSQQIRALEEELEVQLFRRKPRGVELTDAGHSFFEDARAILASIDHAIATAQRTARGEQGKIVVGFTMTASLNPFVPATVRAFQQVYPDVSVVLDERSTEELAKEIEAEKIDVAFVRADVSDILGVTTNIVLKEKLIAAVPTGHRITRARRNSSAPMRLSAFAGEHLILYKRRAGIGQHDALYNTIVTACQREGFTPLIAQEAPQIVSTLNLVAAGLGVTIVPDSLRNLQLPGVTFVDLASPHLASTIYLAFRTSGVSATARNFVQLVRHRTRPPRTGKRR